MCEVSADAYLFPETFERGAIGASALIVEADVSMDEIANRPRNIGLATETAASRRAGRVGHAGTYFAEPRLASRCRESVHDC